MLSSRIVVAAALLCSALQGKDANLEFGYWAEHKIGSWVKVKMEIENQDVKVSSELTHTLTEAGQDRVLVERKSKTTFNGQEQPEKTAMQELLRDKDKDPVKIEKEGEEEIEVAGKKLKCRRVEGTQGASKVKLWLSKEIPGGVAKGEISGGPFPATMRVSAVAWEKK
jgi:hypothetical protein